MVDILDCIVEIVDETALSTHGKPGYLKYSDIKQNPSCLLLLLILYLGSSLSINTNAVLLFPKDCSSLCTT